MFISIIDPILILSSSVFPSFNLLLGYHNLCDSIVILLSLTMGSLKQLPHWRKCWSCICSLFYFSDITPNPLMSMNRRIGLRQDIFPLYRTIAEMASHCVISWLESYWVFFCTVSFDTQECLQELFGNHWHRFTNQYLSTHHGSYIRYAPMFSGYNKNTSTIEELVLKVFPAVLFSPSQTPAWPLPRSPPGAKIPTAGVLMSSLIHCKGVKAVLMQQITWGSKES